MVENIRVLGALPACRLLAEVRATSSGLSTCIDLKTSFFRVGYTGQASFLRLFAADDTGTCGNVFAFLLGLSHVEHPITGLADETG
jgi:hypothetical protein